MNELAAYALTTDEPVCVSWRWLQLNTEIIFQTRKEQSMNTDQQEQWAIIELMGHQQIAGRYQEAAGGMHRIDVPDTAEDAPADSFRFTRLYSPAAIYSITFTDEKSARVAARLLSPRPIAIFGFENEMRRLAMPAKQGDTLDLESDGYGPEFEHDPDDDDDDDFADDDFLDDAGN